MFHEILPTFGEKREGLKKMKSRSITQVSDKEKLGN